MHRATAFGLRWDSDIALAQFAPGDNGDVPADIVVRRAPEPLPPREAAVAFDNASLCTNGIRFHAGDEAVIDLYPPGRVEWTPGPGWTGQLPPPFFATLTALLLAWRGGMPIHGTAVEIQGEAILICGRSGAGKSTLAAALIAHAGARLIADDLSVLQPDPGGGMPLLPAGRPAMRLFPAIAGLMAEAGIATRDEPGSDKRLVMPPRIAPSDAPRLAAMILLDRLEEPADARRKAALLREQLFRPRWMAAMPGREWRAAMLSKLGASLPLAAVAPEEIGDARSFALRADAALRALRGTIMD